jgi:hypothetical protein
LTKPNYDTATLIATKAKWTITGPTGQHGNCPIHSLLQSYTIAAHFVSLVAPNLRFDATNRDIAT